jgi:hypothetical protein
MSADEPIAHRPRCPIRHRRSPLALAQEDAFIASSRRHFYRPTRIEVHLPDYDDVDRERDRIGGDVAAETLIAAHGLAFDRRASHLSRWLAKALRSACVSGGGPPPTSVLERIVSMKSRIIKTPRIVSGE